MGSDMHIKFQPAFEHPVGFAATIFLSVCSLFAMGVGILNFGRYGYLPPIDFFWSCLVLLVLINIKVSLEQEGNCWSYTVSLFRKKFINKKFDTIELIQTGKICTVFGVKGNERIRTLISGDDTFKNSIGTKFFNTL